MHLPWAKPHCQTFAGGRAASICCVGGSGRTLCVCACVCVCVCVCAGLIAAACGAVLLCENAFARIDRGAGLPHVNRLPYLPQEAAKYVQTCHTHTHAHTRNPKLMKALTRAMLCACAVTCARTVPCVLVLCHVCSYCAMCAPVHVSAHVCIHACSASCMHACSALPALLTHHSSVVCACPGFR